MPFNWAAIKAAMQNQQASSPAAATDPSSAAAQAAPPLAEDPFRRGLSGKAKETSPQFLSDLYPEFHNDNPANVTYFGAPQLNTRDEALAFLQRFYAENPDVLIDPSDIEYGGGGALMTYKGGPVWRSNLGPSDVFKSYGESGEDVTANPAAWEGGPFELYSTRPLTDRSSYLYAPNEGSTLLDQLIRPIIFGGLAALTGGALGGMFGSGAGAGMTASELAAADIALGGAGGSAGAASLGAAGAGAGAGGAFAGLAQPAAQVGVNTLLSGGNVEQALRNYALGQGVGFGADLAAPAISAGVDSLGFMQDPADYDWLANPEGSTLGTRAIADPELAGIPINPSYLPGLSSGMLPASMEGTPEFEAEPVPPSREPTVTGKDLQRYIKVAQKVNDLLGEPGGAPQRGEGQSDSEYADQLGQYLGLDAQAMADAGLQPGSPEYLDYIMTQADSVIEQVLGDIDVDSEDLAAQLRGKTEQELQALQRALYVRGQMDLMMGSGRYTDPATGLSQEVIGQGMFNPTVGAYQRGRAEDVEALAGLQGREAQDYLSNLLGRDTDFFGMQEAQDARRELARRTEREDEGALRRRRGMFGGY